MRILAFSIEVVLCEQTTVNKTIFFDTTSYESLLWTRFISAVPVPETRNKKCSFFRRIIVALALERLVAVRFALWSRFLCTVTNARRIIVGIFLLAFVAQFHQLLFKTLDCSLSKSSNLSSSCRCKTKPTLAFYDVVLTIYVWRLLLMTVLPLVIIVTSNILIMKQLSQSTTLNDYQNRNNDSRRRVFVLYKISRMLVLVSSTYLFLYAPGSFLDLFKFVFTYLTKKIEPRISQRISLFENIFDLLTNLNYGINFYLYIISGKHIRKEFLSRPPFFRRFKSNAESERFFHSSYLNSPIVRTARKANLHQISVPLAQRSTGSSI